MITAIAFLAVSLAGAGSYVEVTYPPSTTAGELPYGVTYTLWVPDGVATIRGVIVHQHGCGSGACKGGATAAYDLHWQALATKWDCALLGPSYQQEDKQECRLWCDPRNGSEKTFLTALGELATKAKHPEIATAPWCLWGHSGGGTWSSIMQLRHPERCVAIWLRSGTSKKDVEAADIPPAVLGVPVMCNPGAKENGDARFNGAWTGTLAMFKAYRAKGAPIGFAPDLLSAHECGGSRYLAIPFFDACLALRLPEAGSTKLKPIDVKSGWLGTLLGDSAVAPAAYTGKPEESVWLPNAAVAKAWSEYVRTGAIADTTPPAAPAAVTTATTAEGMEIRWQAAADFESGLSAFVIQRDGADYARLPEKAVLKHGRSLFQAMSFHDTPEKPMPEMRFVDKAPVAGSTHVYSVITVNGVGLKSEPAKAAAP